MHPVEGEGYVNNDEVISQTTCGRQLVATRFETRELKIEAFSCVAEVSRGNLKPIELL